MGIVKKGFNIIKQRYFPNQQEINCRKWRKDGGDFNLVPVHDLNENSLVMDIGGYRGDFAAEIYARYSCYIKVFEPVPASFEVIKKRFSKNRKIELFNIGLGGKTCKVPISINEFSSSTHRNVGGKTLDIDIIDIAEWIEQNIKGRIALMKINIEGEEYDLLDRLIEKGFIPQIENIQIQFHNFFETATQRMEKIQSELSRTHELTYQYPFVWENWKLKK